MRQRTEVDPNQDYSVPMSTPRIFGVIFLIAGAVLIIVGVTASRSVADNLSTFFRGHLTQNTLWYIFGGIASAVVGLVLITGSSAGLVPERRSS